MARRRQTSPGAAPATLPSGANPEQGPTPMIRRQRRGFYVRVRDGRVEREQLTADQVALLEREFRAEAAQPALDVEQVKPLVSLLLNSAVSLETAVIATKANASYDEIRPLCEPAPMLRTMIVESGAQVAIKRAAFLQRWGAEIGLLLAVVTWQVAVLSNIRSYAHTRLGSSATREEHSESSSGASTASDSDSVGPEQSIPVSAVGGT